MIKPVYHIVVQGVHNGGAFDSDLKKEMYWERIVRYKRQLNLQLYAFSIFNNHAHFLVRGNEDEVTDLMRRVGVSYSHWYRRQYNHEGNLFRGRPLMEKLSSDGEILKVTRFIHQEPVREGMVETMSAYPWCSYWMYQAENPIIDRDEITERLRFWGRFEDYMSIREPVRYLEEKEAHFGYTDIEAMDIIRRRLQGHPLIEFECMPMAIRNYLLAVLRFVDEISILQLSRVSGVGRGIVQRITRAHLDLTLFQGSRALRLQGEDLPKEVLDHPEKWFIVTQKQSTFRACDMMIPFESQAASWYRDPAETKESDYEAAARSCREELRVRYQPASMVYVERKHADGQIRPGMIGCIDLEDYSRDPEADMPIRSLQKADPEAVSSSLRNRESYMLDWPHVVLAIDDPENRLIRPLVEHRENMQPLYDVVLGNGDTLSGMTLPKSLQDPILEGLDVLADPGYFANRYKTNDAKFTFIVLEGEEELQAASLQYEHLKASLGKEEASRHPARYLLAEIVNLRDEGVTLYTSYPVLSDADPEVFLTMLKEAFPGIKTENARKGDRLITYQAGAEQGQLVLLNGKKRKKRGQYPLQDLLPLLETYCRRYGAKLMLVLDPQEAIKRGKERRTLAFVWEPLTIEDLIHTVTEHRLLPKGAFSAGLPHEQRMRMEARLLQR